MGALVRGRHRQRGRVARLRASSGHSPDRYHVDAGSGAGRTRFSAAGHFAAVIGSFLAGTVLSGFIIQNSTLQLGRRYGIPLLLESALLCVSVPLFEHNNVWGVYAAARACGLQNAMVSPLTAARQCAPRTSPGCSPIWASFWVTRCAACRWTPAACGFATSLFLDSSAAGSPGLLLSEIRLRRTFHPGRTPRDDCTGLWRLRNAQGSP
jgi:hypothetical protein